MIIHLVAGARPNFIKLAPVAKAILERGCQEPRIVHTGQHYDGPMDAVFFEELGIPAPAYHLGVGSGTHGAQTARILERYEDLLLREKPAATVVFGDVNSTVACALAAVKLGVPVVHVEAGLRSFDRTMPEEINRLLTDAVSELLFVTEPSGAQNLQREGVPCEKVRLAGNVMIDALLAELPVAVSLDMPGRMGLKPRGYGLLTLHRPSNVDAPETLAALVDLFVELSGALPLVFPMHPRTRVAVAGAALQERLESSSGLRVLEPLSYRENLGLMAQARLVLTDSGGMQEETSVLGVPCITLRDNTERPVTLEMGTSTLAGNDPRRIRKAFKKALAAPMPEPARIPFWDGRAGQRIASELAAWLAGR